MKVPDLSIHTIWTLLSALLFISCSPETKVEINLIPKPAQIETGKGFYQTDKIEYTKEEPEGNLPEEGYQLVVGKSGVILRASSSAGFFYGEQTLRQLMTPEGIPYVSIQDTPRLPYRGYMLDVSRHFYPKEFIFKLLDEMAYYKLNTLHMHLTDGGGWRLQMESYPELTRKASFRTMEGWSEWWKSGARFLEEGTPGAYGGYYTKADMREIIAYATERHINVLPEIELPGHSYEVFVAYPNLCCSGKPYNEHDFCVGNEESFTFLENVLTEVMELFPSEYIHIGGDEAGKTPWKTCPKCQARMKKNGLKNVDELQSYMIHRIDEFITSKGRKLVGWDEILEGGVSPNAIVMSWQSEMGGIRAARMGHDVIMTPNHYLYLDYYQADAKTQPFAIGGYTPVKRVYSYNPVPADSLNAGQMKHIIGVQANLWTEFVPDEAHVEYMTFPRLLALAEVAWTPQNLREWQDFKPRMNVHVNQLREKGVNAFPLSDELDVSMVVDTLQKKIEVSIDAEKYPAEVRYTTDGSAPTASSPLYTRPVVVKDSAHIVAAIFENGVLQGVPSEKKVDYHRGINKPIRYNNRLSSKYMAGGMNALLDGYRGGPTYMDGRWQGYTTTLDCVVDMEELTRIHKVSLRFMQLTGPDVYQPGSVELFTSKDGADFTFQQEIPTTVSTADKELSFQEYTFTGDWDTRFIRIKANEVNGRRFIFTDEIVIW